MARKYTRARPMQSASTLDRACSLDIFPPGWLAGWLAVRARQVTRVTPTIKRAAAASTMTAQDSALMAPSVISTMSSNGGVGVKIVCLSSSQARGRTCAWTDRAPSARLGASSAPLSAPPERSCDQSHPPFLDVSSLSNLGTTTSLAPLVVYHESKGWRKLRQSAATKRDDRVLSLHCLGLRPLSRQTPTLTLCRE